MKKLLTLCTKNVHFTLNNEIYARNDGVAMGYLLGPILANVFMVNLRTHWFLGCISMSRNGDAM